MILIALKMYEIAININFVSQMNKFSGEPANNQKLQIFNCAYQHDWEEGERMTGRGVTEILNQN
jgi:hypothetical protein